MDLKKLETFATRSQIKYVLDFENKVKNEFLAKRFLFEYKLRKNGVI